MSVKIIFISIAFILAGLSARSNNLENRATVQVFNFIYNQQYDKADSSLSANRHKIGNLTADILSVDLKYWRCVTNNSKDSFNQFEAFLHSFNLGEEGSDENKIRQLVVYMYSLRLYYKHFNVLKFNITWIKMKLLLNRLDEKTLLVLGSGNDLIGVYNSVYKYLSQKLNPFSFLKKQNSGELTLLEKNCESEILIVNTLSNYFVGKLYLKFEKEPGKALGFFQVLMDRYPENEVFRGLAMECESEIQPHN